MQTQPANSNGEGLDEGNGTDDGTPIRSGLSLSTKLFRVLAGLAIAASFAVWVYAYSGLAKRDPPDLLADRAVSETAETVCASAQAEIDGMPNALDAADEKERASQINLTTNRYEQMVTELEGIPVSGERDSQIFSSWLSDWRVMIDDRRTYAEAIAADPDAQFLISDIGVSERLDKRLTRFANTNFMPTCAAPTDVG